MPDCETTFEKQLQTAKGQAEYQDMVRLITQVLDAAITGADCSLRIGTTKNRSGLLATLYQDGEATYASATDWFGFLAAMKSLL